MNEKKNVLAFVLVNYLRYWYWLLLLLAASAPAQAQFDYTTNASTINITKYTGPGGAVAIPATINNLPVASIGTNAFYNCTGLTSVTIPGSVNSIGDYAFEVCNNLTTVTISNGVTSIGEGVFQYCSGLTSITIPGSVTSIGDYAFNGCNRLTSITIPNGVTSIGDFEFGDCDFSSITIPGSVTSIGEYAFNDCRGLSTIKIPIGVTSIAEGAFSTCVGLTNVTIPDSVTSIGEYAFEECSFLTSVTIPSSVTSIGVGAFYGCTTLIAITVDSQDLFYSSTNGVLFDKSQTTIIQYPGGLGGSYTIPGTVANIAEQAFESCSFLTNVTIPGSVTSIGELAFAESGLTTVTIPGSAASIGEFAFESCSSLTNVTIYNGVTTIGEQAFQSCSMLSSVTIPASLTSIGDYAFVNCTDLTSVYFQGNAPAADSTVFSDDNTATIYYLPGTTGWSSPFAGLPAVMLTPPTQTGALQVTITPAAAITAGAQWQVDGGVCQTNGATVSGLTVGNHTVGFSTVAGWITPASQTITVISNQTTVATGIYSLEPTLPPVSGCAIFTCPTDTILINGHTLVTNQMTIEAEIHIPSSFTVPSYGSPRIFEEQLSGSGDKQFWASPSAVGGSTWVADNQNNGGISLADSIGDDVWHHLAFVHDSNEVREYLDGVQIGKLDFSGDPSIANSPNSVMSIGAFLYTGGGALAQSFIGAVQWVRVSCVARYSGASVTPPVTVPPSDAFTQVLFDFSHLAFGTSNVYDLSPNHFTGVVAMGFSGATAPSFVLPAAPAFQTVTQANHSLTLTWSTVPGQIYQIQYTTSLTQANWSDLGYPLVATNGVVTVSDNTCSDTQRFYRVVQSQ